MKKDDPQPDQDSIRFENGWLTLPSRLHAFWLEKFDGDAARLELALVQAAGFVQPNSYRPLEAQVSSQLARAAADKRDRDKRYAIAAKANSAKPKAEPKDGEHWRDRQARQNDEIAKLFKIGKYRETPVESVQ